MTNISYLIFGFGLFISYGDLVELTNFYNIAFLVTFLAMILVIYAVANLSIFYMKQQYEIYKVKQEEDKNKKNKSSSSLIHPIVQDPRCVAKKGLTFK